MTSLPVAILGATGTVGQKAIALLKQNKKFHVSEVIASEQNVGKVYGEVVNWREQTELPKEVAALIIKSYENVSAKYVISALPSDQARIMEPYLAAKGKIVVSNASTFRMDEQTPLLIPEVNADHLSLVHTQKTSGKIITNPNCSTVMLACALKPLLSLGEIDHISVVTLQAASGAGYPGVSSLDLIGNTIPFIGSEEDKIESEAEKILGTFNQDKIIRRKLSISCHVNRVPVVDGHSVVIHIYYKNAVNLNRARELFLSDEKQFKLHLNDFHPQPKRDLTADDMRLHIGRLKLGHAPNVLGLVSLGHNLVRGAAGAAIANLELCLEHHL